MKIFFLVILLNFSASSYSQKESAEIIKNDYKQYLNLFKKVQQQESGIVDSLIKFNANAETLTGKAFSNLLLGYFFYNQNLNKADSCFYVAKDLFVLVKDEKGIANTNLTITTIAEARGDYKSALIGYFEILKLDYIQNDTLQTARMQNNIGSVFFHLKDYEKSKMYFQKSFAIFKTYKEYRLEITSLINLGDIEYETNNLIVADSLYNEALSLATFHKYPVAIAEALTNIAHIQISTKEIEQALSNYKIAEDLLKNKEFSRNKASVDIGLGDCYYYLKQYQKSKKHYTRALIFYNQGGYDYILNTLYPDLIDVEESLKNYKEAFQYQKLYQTILDSSYNSDKLSVIEDIEQKYENEKKQNEIFEKENKILKQHNQLEKRNNQNKLLVLGIFALVFLISIGIYNYKKKITRNKELLVLNQFKTQVLKIVGHDLRAPLSNIVATSNETLTIQKTNIVLNILNDLLTWGTSSKNQLTGKFNLGKLLHELEDESYELINSKSITVNITSNHSENLKMKKDEMFIILRNLFTNAIKYSPENSTIQIKYDAFHIEFKNTVSENITPSTQKGFEIVRFLCKRNNYTFSIHQTDIFISTIQF